MARRTLTEWETTLCEALHPLGFIYHPNQTGDGYWWHTKLGLQLTDDLEFLSRGVSRAWILKRVEGLKIYTLRLPHRKRVAHTEAEEIVGRLSFLSKPDWKSDTRWNCLDLS